MTNTQLEKVLDKKLEEFQTNLRNIRENKDHMEFEERYIGRIETLHLVKEILMSPKEWLENYEIN